MRRVDVRGRTLTLERAPRRIVSLVPSDTHTVFSLSQGHRLVGRTTFCVHPEAAARVPPVGGTKTTRLDVVLGLRPDLVLANREENTADTVGALEAAGLPVWVSQPGSVVESLDHVADLGALLGVSDAAAALVAATGPLLALPPPPRRMRALTFIWRNPWMALGVDTYGFDLVCAAGFEACCPGDATRYPVLDEAAIATSGADIVFFPSEPYVFTEAHVEAFARTFPDLPAVIGGGLRRIPGEHVTWHGAWTADGLRWMAALRHRLEQELPWRS